MEGLLRSQCRDLRAYRHRHKGAACLPRDTDRRVDYDHADIDCKFGCGLALGANVEEISSAPPRIVRRRAWLDPLPLGACQLYLPASPCVDNDQLRRQAAERLLQRAL